MLRIGSPTLSGRLPQGRVPLVRTCPVTDGLLGGAVPGLATLAAIYLAPWWLTEVVGFLTAPVLLVAFLAAPQQPEAMWVAIVLGSMALYAGYGALMTRWRTEQARVGWLLVIMVTHGACLILWVGLFLSKVGERLLPG